MKAYIIKIELLDSYPLIWRRVVMPADATFRRLHDVIQTVTNFLSGGSYGGYHLYEFDLSAENITVTNDEESFEEYQYYKQNKKQYEERLRLAPIGSFQRSSLERLMKTVVRQPSRIKIDKYLEKYKEIRYSYDFGDGWEFLITLEQTVDKLLKTLYSSALLDDDELESIKVKITEDSDFTDKKDDNSVYSEDELNDILNF